MGVAGTEQSEYLAEGLQAELITFKDNAVRTHTLLKSYGDMIIIQTYTHSLWSLSFVSVHPHMRVDTVMFVAD